MGTPLFQVDAFTDKPFSGNPAAICLLPGPHDGTWMQQVAKEMNLSETAFLYRHRDGYQLLLIKEFFLLLAALFLNLISHFFKITANNLTFSLH